MFCQVAWCFFDMMIAELNHLALGYYPAEHCLVFGSVILQKDRMIKKGSDNHHLLEKCINLWQKVNLICWYRKLLDVITLFISIIVDLRTLKIMLLESFQS